MAKHPLENSKMSCEAMKMLAHEIADLSADGPNWKQRVEAVATAINSSFGRAFTLYYATARRVDADEMDAARAAKNELKNKEEARKNAEHLLWLESQIAGLREGDADFRGPHINALEHFLCRMRGETCAMDNQKGDEQ